MNGPATDIVGAVVAYLQGAMRDSLASATGYAQAYADYAPQLNPDGSPVSQPYAVVTEAGVESYRAQSEDPATGFVLSNIADGFLRVSCYASTKQAARSLGREVLHKLSDTQAQFAAADGRVIAVLPLHSESVTLGEPGIGEPAAYLRVVTCNYKQQITG